jgi:hypothetical protein
MDHRLADVGHRCCRTILPEETLAMNLGFVIPIVGPAVGGAPGLSALCRGLEDLGYDTLWVGDRLVTPVDVGADHGIDQRRVRRRDPAVCGRAARPAEVLDRLSGPEQAVRPPVGVK